jgi:hypothetical protein
MLELSFAVRALGGETRRYGALGMGFLDRNFALTAAGGSISVRALDGGSGQIIELAQGFGQLEEGQLRNLPRAVPIAYDFVQGQRIDTARLLARARADELLPLVPPSSSLRGELERLGGRTVPAELAERVDADVRARAGSDPGLRRRAAPVLVAHLARAALPERAGDRTTSTQFAARLLAESCAGRVVGEILGAAVREAGQLDGRGVFHRYPAHDELVDPVAILDVNDVSLWRARRGGRFSRARLERRTVLLFDAGAGAFLMGFQEVFHDER